MKIDKLKVLRAQEYVIPKCCALCLHEETEAFTDHSRCKLLKTDVLLYGCCKRFALEETRLQWLDKFRPLLDRRKFTRSNRFKAPTSY